MFYLFISNCVLLFSAFFLQKTDKDTIFYLHSLNYIVCQGSIYVKKHKARILYHVQYIVLLKVKGRELSTLNLQKKPPQINGEV